jgi:hypothetical protein
LHGGGRYRIFRVFYSHGFLGGVREEVIFAVDFDGTIVTHEFPAIGTELPGAIETLKALQKAGHKIIIWTCRCEPYLAPMSQWLLERGFVPDAVNCNVEAIAGFGIPKILFDVNIDDRNFPAFKGWESVRQEFLEIQNEIKYGPLKYVKNNLGF